MIRELTVDSQRYLPVNRSSAHLSLIGSHLDHFAKPLTCTEDNHAHHSHCLVSNFCLLIPALPQQHAHIPAPQKSPLKALPNIFGMCHKIHGMVTRYGSKDTEDILDTQDSTPFDLAPQDHPVPEGDNDSFNEYCEETDTHHPLTDLLEQFQQLKNQFAILKSNTLQSTPTEELLQSQISYSISP